MLRLAVVVAKNVLPVESLRQIEAPPVNSLATAQAGDEALLRVEDVDNRMSLLNGTLLCPDGLQEGKPLTTVEYCMPYP